MKRILFTCLSVIFISACSSSDDAPATIIPEPQIQKGTGAYIRAQIGDDAYDSMVAHGFEIHLGTNPPIVNGTFEITGSKIIKTDVPDDFSIGTNLGVGYITFENQNSQQLELDYFNEQQLQAGTNHNAQSSFIEDDGTISGDGEYFTVVSTIYMVTVATYQSYETHVISGRLTADGIVDCKKFVYMRDNNGNTQYYFENGKSRVYADSDGVAEFYE
jgi:hypothetical protein